MHAAVETSASLMAAQWKTLIMSYNMVLYRQIWCYNKMYDINGTKIKGKLRGPAIVRYINGSTRKIPYLLLTMVSRSYGHRERSIMGDDVDIFYWIMPFIAAFGRKKRGFVCIQTNLMRAKRGAFRPFLWAVILWTYVHTSLGRTCIPP